jgi:hypothetical protein
MNCRGHGNDIDENEDLSILDLPLILVLEEADVTRCTLLLERNAYSRVYNWKNRVRQKSSWF